MDSLGFGDPRYVRAHPTCSEACLSFLSPPRSGSDRLLDTPVLTARGPGDLVSRRGHKLLIVPSIEAWFSQGMDGVGWGKVSRKGLGRYRVGAVGQGVAHAPTWQALSGLAVSASLPASYGTVTACQPCRNLAGTNPAPNPATSFRRSLPLHPASSLLFPNPSSRLLPNATLVIVR
jgi:hypothetical protein